jgi:UDP-N-acetylglucosamine 2-epimerase (non-hydrolysing)/GDP/UDP-N,N'-diacetylbacillosamine 2-epimerase (hydrolysing)
LPTVNIGDRQKGRLRAASVIDVDLEAKAIAKAVHEAVERGRQDVVNPYGDGHSAKRIVHSLRQIPDFRKLLRKPFNDEGENG